VLPGEILSKGWKRKVIQALPTGSAGTNEKETENEFRETQDEPIHGTNQSRNAATGPSEHPEPVLRRGTRARLQGGYYRQLLDAETTNAVLEVAHLAKINDAPLLAFAGAIG
jgi:hypothetical protein